jgi:predicted acyl esterase
VRFFCCSWWEPLDLSGKFNLVHGPSGFWAGWYDIFLVGDLAAYKGYNTECDPLFRHSSRILIDPLGHCQSAAEYFTEDIIAGRTALAVAQSFDTFGVREVVRTDIKNVTFYVMSSNDDAGREAGQFWTTMESFPVPKMTSYYLQPDNKLSDRPPAGDSTELSSSYKYDPR